MPLPTQQHLEWSDCEIGVLIHYDMPVFAPEYQFREQWGYTPSPDIFSPSDLDTDQWLATAAAVGAKYAVLTSKHCTGFCLWPTRAYDYHIGKTPYKNGHGDIVDDFVKSCNKYGIKPGLYYSTVCNAYLNVDNPGLVRSGKLEEQVCYNRIVRQQLTELWSNYGKWFEIWFDGGYLSPELGGFDVAGLLQELQPQAIIFQGPPNSKALRWVGNEHGHAPYPCWSTNDFISDSDGIDIRKDLSGNPNGRIWCPAEADTPNRSREKAFQNGWFWKKGEDHLVRPVDELFNCYCETVGRNCNLLLGMVIDDRGRIPDTDVAQFTGLGEIIREHLGTASAETSGQGEVLEIRFDKPTPINAAVIMEDIRYGDNVLAYKLEAFTNGAWQPVVAGQCIGHKRIERFLEITCLAFRIKCTEIRQIPHIRSFKLFRHNEAKYL